MPIKEGRVLWLLNQLLWFPNAIIRCSTGEIFIVNVKPGGGCDKEGVLVGSQLLAIDGVDVTGYAVIDFFRDLGCLLALFTCALTVGARR
jgi:hypothetical protein